VGFYLARAANLGHLTYRQKSTPPGGDISKRKWIKRRCECFSFAHL